MSESQSTDQPRNSELDQKNKGTLPEEKSSVTQHKIYLDGHEISYTATTGLTHLRNSDEKSTAAIFYTAYTRNGVEDLSSRPLTFCFNGGTGLMLLISSISWSSKIYSCCERLSAAANIFSS